MSSLAEGGLPSAATFASLYQAGQTATKSGIMHRLKDDTEGTIVLVGKWEVFIIQQNLFTFTRFNIVITKQVHGW